MAFFAIQISLWLMIQLLLRLIWIHRRRKRKAEFNESTPDFSATSSQLIICASVQSTCPHIPPTFVLIGSRSLEADRRVVNKASLAPLNRVAKLTTPDSGGRPEEGLQVLLASLGASWSAGRESLLGVLADGAETLAAVDQGELLLKVHQELENIDGWFSTQAPSWNDTAAATS
jgi:hypothetical protein